MQLHTSWIFYFILGNYSLSVELENVTSVTGSLAENGMYLTVAHVLATLPLNALVLTWFIVVSIISVLAAVIIPNIGKFIGSGEQGAKDVEWETVQSGLELMVVDKAVVNVTPYDNSNSSTATNSWVALPVGGPGVVPLTDYLESPTSVYYYCYDTNARVSEQSHPLIRVEHPRRGLPW